ncbi:MAG: ArsA family ATPase [Myxococcota bacterium]
MGLLERRVVLVTGKGGVGKTVVSTLVALAASRRGRRTLLAETSGATRVPPLFGAAGGGYEPTRLSPTLWTQSIDPASAIEDYVVMQLRFRRLYKMVFRNRIMGPFVDAVPGLHDLIQLGKVFQLVRDDLYDTIVVDAPATGHGLTMLAAPRAMMELTVAGPFHDNARDVAGLFEDPELAALVLVSLPEELPLNETEDLWRRLGPLRSLVRGVVLNEVHPSPVPDGELYGAWRRYLHDGADEAGREALELVDAGLARLGAQDAARRRLAALEAPVVEVPFLFRRDLSRADLEPLSSLVDGL